MGPYADIYREALDREGVANPAELVAIGDEEVVARQVRDYVDAGVTELVYTQTALGSPADERRTWQLLGSLTGN